MRGRAPATSRLRLPLFLDSLDPVDGFIGLYDAGGNLLATHDPGAPDGPGYLEFEVTETGTCYGAITACCELPGDPFDPASAAGVNGTGTYELIVDVASPPCVSREDDGSISLATPTYVDQIVQDWCTGEIGDGPHGTTSGDTDFYEFGLLEEGQVMQVDLYNGLLEPGFVSGTIAIYDAYGNVVAALDDDGDPTGSEYISVPAPASGRYYAAVTGCCELPTDPFDPASGAGTAETGHYQVYIAAFPPPASSATVNEYRLGAADPPEARWQYVADLSGAPDGSDESEADTDFFLVDLRRGDAISGGFDDALLSGIIAPDGEITTTSPQNLSFNYPADSPLRHARRNGFDHVATTSGLHAVFVADGVGAYEGELRVTRSGLEERPFPAHQTIFLDFDGAEVSPGTFSGSETDPVLGIGPDQVFGTDDDPDPDFAVDTFNTFEGLLGVEDTVGRSVHGLAGSHQHPGREDAAAG